MGRGEEADAAGRATLYCLVPRDLASKLHEPLRRHFREEPSVEVVVERRRVERRAAGERRDTELSAQRPTSERRRIHNAAGRRVGERRAALVHVDAAELPRRARAHAERLTFVERLVPGAEAAEETDSARLVTRFQAGEREAYTEIYMRYFDRVYAYLRIALRNEHEAEDMTQQVFMRALEALPRYERRTAAFGAWLFRIVRNHAIDQLHLQNRTDVEDPAELDRRREQGSPEDDGELHTLNWISDRDLVFLVERLPLAQRQVLVLRYMLGLRMTEIAATLSLSPNHVSVLQYRALAFLRARLSALGREPVNRRGGGSRLVRFPKQARVLRRRRFALSP